MRVDRVPFVRLIAPWVIVEGGVVIAVSDRASARRVAQLLERHGWHDVPLDVMPDMGDAA